jgi:Flp pilus assembly pilin Flp
MRRARQLVRRIQREEGQSLVEYGLIITLIVILVIGSLTLISGQFNSANSL